MPAPGSPTIGVTYYFDGLAQQWNGTCFYPVGADNTAAGNTSGVEYLAGTGSPEGAYAASIGSVYTRTNGGAGTTLYVKESGTGNTGWVAK